MSDKKSTAVAKVGLVAMVVPGLLLLLHYQMKRVHPGWSSGHVTYSKYARASTVRKVQRKQITWATAGNRQQRQTPTHPRILVSEPCEFSDYSLNLQGL